MKHLHTTGTILLSILALVFVATACDDTNDKRSRGMRFESIGGQSEVVLVADQAITESDLKDTLNDILGGDTPGLMQSEPIFNVIHVVYEHQTRKYAAMHSIVYVHIDPACKTPTLGTAYNVDAHPQVIVKVTAPDLASLRTFLPKQKDQIRDLLVDTQLEVQENFLKRHNSKQVFKDLQAYGYTITVPEDIAYTKKGKDFLWGSARRDEKDYNFVFYTYPYAGKPDTTDAAFTFKRDSVMHQNIPGSDPSTQWVQTVKEQDEPIIFSRMRDIDGQRVQEVHGLWEMRNGAMGGPFVSLVRIDTVAHKVVVTEGFIFSPSTKKRDLLRTMEASLRTLHKVKK